jgi:hypothetical protein
MTEIENGEAAANGARPVVTGAAEAAGRRSLSPKVTQSTAPGVFDDDALGQYLGGIEPRTLRLWRRNRGLPFLKLTKKVIRYRKADVDGWLDQHRVACVGGAA